MKKICVIGLGYVGLPLAVALSKHYSVVGFDINQERIQELQRGYDRTAEIDKSTLKTTALHVTHNVEEIEKQEIYIVTVPTPITKDNKPDLTPLEKACETLGKVIQKDSIIVFESTVYPGVTEDICGPLLAKTSGLTQGKDFFLGYSPERINPGDKVHTVDKITKVVAGETPSVTELLVEIYGTMNNNNIFQAASIKTAEAAKVIENAQRDINIAFINEAASIFNKVGVSIYDVLEAAKTKWNFLPFEPGLVGGHCIGVDPYYLAHLSKEIGHEPEVILSGRETNESMPAFIAERLAGIASENKKRLLILGLTFKENVPDLRNTKVVDLMDKLKKQGFDISVHDPYADPEEARKFYGLELLTSLDGLEPYDMILGAVPHKEYRALSQDQLQRLTTDQGCVADLKAMWRNLTLEGQRQYWSL
ncbi:MAG: nucleotide sugar dehydrogenase [Alphaproteobacteria bacterium]|nr:nucleotide sugar dehydrogenase [Alphaproteobacteria bacterium]NCQ66593.1 nucleotide sugar dehydrogenase [Alphaproteobacteria bacterium]NCT06945.1 nucleotide sugar dehydrogenase [Alphaproteobacteria bacterium]